MYQRTLDSGLTIRNTIAADVAALEQLQCTIFPTLSPAERITARHYLHHLELFPEGQFVVEDAGELIGMTTTMRYHLTMEDHSFLEISDGLWLNTHEPHGDWLYGLDMGVLTAYRGRGLAREMYRARQHLCRELGLKGQITVGMPNGYAEYADRLSLDDYYEKIVAGEINDPTVSTQQKIGFQPIRLIHQYLSDPQCGDGGVLMVLPVEQNV
ncbi:MAG: GNAT family N-acetyltransferase [Saprospiraceae bacterium]|nr:GNAT family N-acetyltransferase [Saprospiraceae bacterium]